MTTRSFAIRSTSCSIILQYRIHNITNLDIRKPFAVLGTKVCNIDDGPIWFGYTQLYFKVANIWLVWLSMSGLSRITSYLSNTSKDLCCHMLILCEHFQIYFLATWSLLEFKYLGTLNLLQVFQEIYWLNREFHESKISPSSAKESAYITVFICLDWQKHVYTHWLIYANYILFDIYLITSVEQIFRLTGRILSKTCLRK